MDDLQVWEQEVENLRNIVLDFKAMPQEPTLQS